MTHSHEIHAGNADIQYSVRICQETYDWALCKKLAYHIEKSIMKVFNMNVGDPFRFEYGLEELETITAIKPHPIVRAIDITHNSPHATWHSIVDNGNVEKE
jgi:hypothetical protein